MTNYYTLTALWGSHPNANHTLLNVNKIFSQQVDTVV